jgi:hypothetical protein
MPGLAVTGRGPAAYLTGQQLPRRGKSERRPGRDHASGKSWLGHRDVGGQARDAPRYQEHPRQGCTASASPRLGKQRGRRGDNHPIDRQRRERSDPARLPVTRDGPVHVKVGHRARDQRQQRYTSGRRPPDPNVRLPSHRGPPRRTSSPVIASMYVPGDSLQPTGPRESLHGKPGDLCASVSSYSVTVTGHPLMFRPAASGQTTLAARPINEGPRRRLRAVCY